MRKLVVILICFSMLSCAPSVKGIVIPKENGLYEVQATSNSSDEALKDALESAEAVCKKENARHIVKEAVTDYEGNIPEKTAMLGQLPVTSIVAKSTYRATVIFICE